MLGYAMVAFMVGLLAYWGALGSTPAEPTDSRDRVTAENFVAFRNGAIAYAVKHPGTNTPITLAMMQADRDVPMPYVALGAWQAYVQGGMVYAWGQLSARGINEAVAAAGSANDIGFVRGASVVSPAYGVIGAAPAGAPQSATVSEDQAW